MRMRMVGGQMRREVFGKRASSGVCSVCSSGEISSHREQPPLSPLSSWWPINLGFPYIHQFSGKMRMTLKSGSFPYMKDAFPASENMTV